MKVVLDSDMVLAERSRGNAEPNANSAGPSSEIPPSRFEEPYKPVISGGRGGGVYVVDIDMVEHTVRNEDG
jgi:hypothetical protein